MDTKILKELEAAYSEELNLVAGDLGALEAEVKTKNDRLPCINGKSAVEKAFLSPQNVPRCIF